MVKLGVGCTGLAIHVELIDDANYTLWPSPKQVYAEVNGSSINTGNNTQQVGNGTQYTFIPAADDNGANMRCVGIYDNNPTLFSDNTTLVLSG